MIVLVGWRIYQNLQRASVRVSPSLAKVLGRWSFEAESSHGTRRSGECTISSDQGVLKVVGTFDEDGKRVGGWSSLMAHLDDERLWVVYELDETRDQEPELSRAFCEVDFDPTKVSPMRGRWTVIGRSDAWGTITYTKL